MSAVENVEARIARLQQSLDAKCTELYALQTRQRYNPNSGVDEDIVTGRSVAMLEVKVVGGRNMLYKAGFLAGMAGWLLRNFVHAPMRGCYELRCGLWCD